ncbi:hypothetical protein D9M68_492930 [compost metagenome]
MHERHRWKQNAVEYLADDDRRRRHELRGKRIDAERFRSEPAPHDDFVHLGCEVVAHASYGEPATEIKQLSDCPSLKQEPLGMWLADEQHDRAQQVLGHECTDKRPDAEASQGKDRCCDHEADGKSRRVDGGQPLEPQSPLGNGLRHQCDTLAKEDHTGGTHDRCQFGKSHGIGDSRCDQPDQPGDQEAKDQRQGKADPKVTLVEFGSLHDCRRNTEVFEDGCELDNDKGCGIKPELTGRKEPGEHEERDNLRQGEGPHGQTRPEHAHDTALCQSLSDIAHALHSSGEGPNMAPLPAFSDRSGRGTS